jgi:hypothetical protein
MSQRGDSGTPVNLKLAARKTQPTKLIKREEII